MQLSTITGMSVSVSCCSCSLSPPLPAAAWIAAHQQEKSSFLFPSMYRVLKKEKKKQIKKKEELIDEYVRENSFIIRNIYKN